VRRLWAIAKTKKYFALLIHFHRSTFMKSTDNTSISRRELGKRVGQVAAVSALAGIAIPSVHAAEDSTIQLALVGCGGRGTGAAGDALHVKGVQMKLVAMADAYQDRLDGSFNTLTRNKDFAGKIDVTDERKFIGFDAYKQAMDCLKPGDVVIFATPLAFRWVHFTYAIEKGLNVFMEKPLSSDGAASRRLLKLADEAAAKNLKVGVGLMSRHSRPLQELHQRIGEGEIGDIVLMRGYRMAGTIGTFASPPKPKGITDLEYQIRRFHSFLWAGGGCYSDFNIHLIDHLCWMKNGWPIKAQGVGGRHYRFMDDGTPFVDQNFDSYGVEYTFDDGTKLLFDGRCINGAASMYHSFIHGTKGCAVASKRNDCGAPSSTYKGLAELAENKIWESTDRSSPYQNEWNDLMDAITNNKPYNEVKRGVEASLVTSMGRMAAHTGLEITFDQMLNSQHEFAPGIDKLTADSPAPLQPDANGMYPVPAPGRKKTEY
jgi:predicted dehydrogenase